MNPRYALVLASQCHQLPFLPGLDDLARQLHALLGDPRCGDCQPIDNDSGPGERDERDERGEPVDRLRPPPGLLLDPTVAAGKAAIAKALAVCENQQATLLLAWLGHGLQADDHAGGKFYLLPTDADPGRPSSDTAIDILSLIGERVGPGLDGLILLLDACGAGGAAVNAGRDWVRDRHGRLPFEILAATAPQRDAYDLGFSRALIRIIRQGCRDDPAETLSCARIAERIDRARGHRQQTTRLHFNQTLWVSRNAARPWNRHTGLDAALVDNYQPTDALLHVIDRLNRDHAHLTLTGDAGVGKSALAAILHQWPGSLRQTLAEMPLAEMPPAETGRRPRPSPPRSLLLAEERLIDASYSITDLSSPDELATRLSQQLADEPRFAAARARFEACTPTLTRQNLPILEQALLGPLRQLDADADAPRPLTLLLDSLERLTPASRPVVLAALAELATRPGVRLLTTARPGSASPVGQRLALGGAAPAEIGAYLRRRRVAAPLIEVIIDKAAGNWLVATTFANAYADGSALSAADLGTIRRSRLGDAFDTLARRAGLPADRQRLAVYLTLAAAGAGPLLPIELLLAASARLDGPASETALRQTLTALGGLLASAADAENGERGEREERLGLFHQRLVEHVGESQADGVRQAHAALLQAIAEAADGDPDHRSPAWRYALQREADHCWALGWAEPIVYVLARRESPFPRENLRRWQGWQERLTERLGADHPQVLVTRSNIACWTGESGQPAAALALYQTLLPDEARVLGAEHPDVLTTRNNIAAWTGESGQPAAALALFQALLPDRERVLGAEHPDVLKTRKKIAALATDQ